MLICYAENTWMKSFSFCGEYLHATDNNHNNFISVFQSKYMVLPTILNNFQYVSFIRYSNEKSELKH